MTLYQKYVSCDYKVTTDTRTLKGGEIYFALKGENFDGNTFALDALEKGAAWAVVDESAALPDNAKLIRVPDTYQALRDLAIEHRKSFSFPVIGLTGTNGKTTTKELISAVLRKKFVVYATEGNLNNDIGVPLTILGIRPDAQIAVIEMGANHPDDIAKLVRISQPSFGLITNVGKAHLLGFGSFEGVKAAKGELYKWLGSHEGSLVFLNEDDDDLREMSLGLACHFWPYGFTAQKAQILPLTAQDPFLSLKVGEDTVRTKLVGTYNAVNVLAALAVGEYFGVNPQDAADAVASYTPANSRSQMIHTGRNTLIMDAYNANPSSMAAALDNFCRIESQGKLALLGDMRELGDDSLKEHIAIVERLEASGIEAVLVGTEFGKALERTGAGFRHFDDSNALRSFLMESLPSDRLVLVKGSRGIRMEKVVDVL